MKTLPIPGTDRYLVELEVFHVLHCLDDIRKVFYPEWYGPAILNLTQPDGTLDRDNNFFRHFGKLTSLTYPPSPAQLVASSYF